MGTSSRGGAPSRFKLGAAVFVVIVAVWLAWPQPDLKYEEEILPLARSFMGLEFTTSDQPLASLRVVVTGATSGIGLGLTKQLTNLGATVIALGRNPTKLANLQQSIGPNKIIPITVQLADLESVKQAAEEIINLGGGGVDVLINNAGIHYASTWLQWPSNSKPVTPQDYDLSFGINYLSHFLLTEKLVPLLQNSTHGTVLQITSSFHWTVDGEQLRSVDGQTPSMAQPGGPKSFFFRDQQAYAGSKLAQVLNMKSLHRKYGNSLRSKAICPCWVATNIAGEIFSLLLPLYAFPYDGYGIKSALTAILTVGEDEADYYTNSRITNLGDYIFPAFVRIHPIRDILGFFFAHVVMTVLQKTIAGTTQGSTSPESKDESLQQSLYDWSYNAVKPYL
eukprot:CAMPEP_0194066568 /NCGR_PEP_ID=MMETSP0009_2-20130614/86093_1 /TAXON_ID=210454 /ORGANISM="Grammatophora oceanica, Strain CCMP 410" /LENGTH=392 /DNA_ID=CAMNT_0038719533 /DNA_START=17 /DNA_END=1195 /DNA_ORIENTATION=-